MKKSKKVLSFLTAAMMLGGIALPAEPAMQLSAVLTAQAADAASGTCGENVTWKYDETTKTLTISGTGNMEDLEGSPMPWNSYLPDIECVNIENGVTSIVGWAFCGCSSLTSLTIPDGVTSIGSSAFWDCSSLPSVTIPDSVTSIGDNAFKRCSSLTSVTIPDGVTSIRDDVFYCCSSLASVIIPDGVTSIGIGAFESCGLLTSVKIPDSVMSIGSFAFQGCDSLTSVTIPSSVTSIDSCAFMECGSLDTIIIENPDCEIKGFGTICNEFDYGAQKPTFTGTIYGYDDSTAQAYAEKWGYTFDTMGNIPKLGDVNGDGVINAGDAALTLSAAAAYGATGTYGNMTKAQITAAEIDGNGRINASDAAYILQYAAIRGANGKDFDIRELVK